MTRHRRTQLFLLALVPAVAFAAVRCADSSAPLQPGTPPAAMSAAVKAARIAKLHEETDWIGKFHNDALRYVLEDLRRLPPKSRDKHTICETARRSYADFHRSRRGTPVPASVDAEMESFCAGGSSSSARRAVLNAPPAARRKDVSPASEGLMNRLVAAIDSSTSYSDLSDRVSSVESEAASTLSYEEATDVFVVGSVTLNSATYWANDLTDWTSFTGSPDDPILATNRLAQPGQGRTPATGDWGYSGFSWSAWATSVWNDAKAAAKRAAGADVKAGVKAVLGASLVAGAVGYDAVLGAAAAGSIVAILET